ncbi:Tripeptide aminopeptidase [Klebsiella pneumoniae]|uniref:Tripeptide aminopeptidase n=1 Tax=Klebsiella pneumoniae TaxID=573 RepID=A0A447S5U4_KLEPN|nr:Tripeptide aminopeptidase [Klebsiella pneumoniae]
MVKTLIRRLLKTIAAAISRWVSAMRCSLPVMFPVLHQLLGQTLITTDGKTLLGADDKAGIAEIMTALATLQAKNIPHGDIRVAFTLMKRWVKGRKHFDVEAFGRPLGLYRRRRRGRRTGV